MNKQERIEALAKEIASTMYPSSNHGVLPTDIKCATIAVGFMENEYAELVKAAEDVENDFRGTVAILNETLAESGINCRGGYHFINLLADALNNLKEPSHD